MTRLNLIAKMTTASLCCALTAACLPGTIGAIPTSGGGGDGDRERRNERNSDDETNETPEPEVLGPFDVVTLATATGVVTLDVEALLTNTEVIAGDDVRTAGSGTLEVSYDPNTELFTLTGLGVTGVATLNGPPEGSNPAGYGFFVSQPNWAPDNDNVYYIGVQENFPLVPADGDSTDLLYAFAGIPVPDGGMPSQGSATFTGGAQLASNIGGATTFGEGDATVTANFAEDEVDVELTNMTAFFGSAPDDLTIRGAQLDGQGFSGGTVSGTQVDSLTGTVESTVIGGFFGFNNDKDRPANAAGQVHINGDNGDISGSFVVE